MLVGSAVLFGGALVGVRETHRRSELALDNARASAQEASAGARSSEEEAASKEAQASELHDEACALRSRASDERARALKLERDAETLAHRTRMLQRADLAYRLFKQLSRDASE